MLTRRLTLLAIACLGVLGLAPGVAQGSGAPVEEARANGTFVQMTFNDPAAGGEDLTITNHLRELITNAHPHADVRVALHSITGTGIRDAIINEAPKKDNGVGKLIVVMDSTKMNTTAEELKAGVEANGGQFVECDRNSTTETAGACLGGRAESHQHAKYVLIGAGWKATGASQGYHNYISWIGSANITDSSGWGAYNDAATIYGDQALYDGLRDEIFERQRTQSWGSNDFYDNPPGNGYVHGSSSNVSAFASPETTTDPDTGVDRDQILERLNDVVPGPGCTVAVMQTLFQGTRGQAIAKKLESLKWGSWPSSTPRCNVYVLVDEKDDTGLPSLGTDVKSILCDDYKPVPVKSWPNIHDKALLISAEYLGSYKKVVFTGSHNISDPAREENDEILARIGHNTSSSAIYDRFTQHFSGPFNSSNADNACA